VKPPPYVGITGITTPEQAQALLDMWPASAPPLSLMLGVLASPKSLAGDCNPRSPQRDVIPSLYRHDPRALNLIHYHTKDLATLAEQLIGVSSIRQAHPSTDGVQINVAWPGRDQILEYGQWAPSISRVVLQVGPSMLGSSWSIEVIAELVDREYAGIITDVLVDVSGGRGKPLDPAWARRAVKAFSTWNRDVRIGIAGGLSVETVGRLEPLINGYDLSIDTETAMRTQDDELDLDACHAYLDAAAEIRGWR